jgi:hypothetical protein
VHWPIRTTSKKRAFAQLFAVVKGLYSWPETEHVWVANQRLNTLRSQLAHRLEPRDTENHSHELVNGLVCDMPAGMSDHPEVLIHMNMTLAYVCAHLASLCRPDLGTAAGA